MMGHLKYTILVTGPAYGAQASFCAYQFCQSLLKKQHHIQSVFFYADGVYNANGFTYPANDEFDIISAWQNLANKTNIPLFVCASAAQRRGVLNEDNKNNIAKNFQYVGLGDLSESISLSDRVIQF